MSKTYYVDPVNGDDSNKGLRPKRAWRTLAKAGEVFSHSFGHRLVLMEGEHAGELRLDAAVGASIFGDMACLIGGAGENCLTACDCTGLTIDGLTIAPVEGAHDGASFVHCDGLTVQAVTHSRVTPGPDGSSDGFQFAYCRRLAVVRCLFLGAAENADIIWSSPGGGEGAPGSSGSIIGCDFHTSSPRNIHLHVADDEQGSVVQGCMLSGSQPGLGRAVRVHEIEGDSRLALVSNRHLPSVGDALGLSVGDGVDTTRMHAIGNTWQSAYVNGKTYKASIPGQMEQYRADTGWDAV